MALDKEVNVAMFEGVGAFGATSGNFDADIDWSNFATMNDPLSMSMGTATTVSPKDIFNDPFGSSAPPSTTFTNLTSPSINESPYVGVGDSYDTSPIFPDGDMNPDCWPSLFPDETPAPTAAPIQRTVSEQSLAQSNSTSSSPQPLVLDSASNRRKSSNTNSPYAGVSKPRRRKGPLPPITVTDPNDKIALKRARNTLAARDSRQRKFDHLQTLEKRIAELEDERRRDAEEIQKWKTLALSLGACPQ